MQLADWVFRPGRAATVAVLLLLPLLLTLGFWQLDRARQKTTLQAMYAEQLWKPPIALVKVDPAESANQYRRVIATGQYDGAHQLLLDNQVHDGRPGYHVLTPLRLPGGTAILVNRGWLPLGASRQELPEISLPSKPESEPVTGWLAQPANPGLRLGDGAGGDSQWPRIIPYVDYQRLSSLLAYPLLPAILLLEPGASAGYLRDWQPRFGGYGPERHQGYAMQWFALAVVLLMLYFAANTRRLPRSE